MAKTVEQGFETFLTWLVPLNGEHAKAASHQQSVESCLYSKFGCYDLHETGSFGNGTGVRHRSDTDYFAVLPKANISTNSATVLRDVKEAIDIKFWATEGIGVRSPAVRIPFGFYESETMEVTPCFYSGTVSFEGKQYSSYQIPDSNGGWMQSSPLVHNTYVNNIDTKLRFKVKKLVQLIKAWKYYNNVPIKSFYLEIFVSDYASTESCIVYSIDIRNVFEKLLSNNLKKIHDPTGVSGYINPVNSLVQHEEAIAKIKTALGRAVNARTSEASEDTDSAFHYWNSLFNGNFPSR